MTSRLRDAPTPLTPSRAAARSARAPDRTFDGPTGRGAGIAVGHEDLRAVRVFDEPHPTRRSPSLTTGPAAADVLARYDEADVAVGSGEVVPPGTGQEEVATRLLANPGIEFPQTRNVVFGCCMLTVRRGLASSGCGSGSSNEQ